MIISPPILLPKQNNESDEEWIDRCMTGDMPGSGAYPVSYRLEWHGGLHLTAPVVQNGAAEPVRAIADGKVIYLRKRTEADDAKHPLNYGGGYTSDGCVVVEHTTEIGEGEKASVTFYSVYHHLHTLSPGLKLNQPIYRKEEIGQPGHIYGEPNRLHFEICCDDANLEKIVGRITGDLPTAENGRTDAVYGDVYFFLPSGTPIYDEKPVHYRSDAHRQPPKPKAHAALPAIVPLEGASNTTADLIVGLRYISSENRTATYAPGDACLTTYRLDGSALHNPVKEAEGEYNLYTTATAIAKAWQDAHAANATLYPHVPAASAIYELLRFGRIINTANETLAPADAPHWRKIRHENGEGWVNLNAANVRHFSDADFPHWKGWALIDDDCDSIDSACDSTTIKQWLDVDHNGKVARAEAQAQLSNSVIRSRLKRAICKFPSEWEEATIERRWEWLQQQTDENPEPFTAEEFADLKAHLKAISIPWTALFLAQWRFEPREFIRHFRRCGWLSEKEMAQCFPRKLLHLKKTQFHTESTSWNAASTHAAHWKGAFNRSTRKYGISNSKCRLIHFFSHVIPETGNLSMVKEVGGEDQHYNPYFGRGLIQLTYFENYEAYGKFRNFSAQNPPAVFSKLGWDPNELIARDNKGNHNANNCADSACFYVVKRAHMLSHLDNGLSQEDAITASKDVNGYVKVIENLNGLEARLQAVVYLKSILLDEVILSNQISITFDWRRNSEREAVLDANGHPVTEGNPPRTVKKFYQMQHTINVSLEPQRP